MNDGKNSNSSKGKEKRLKNTVRLDVSIYGCEGEIYIGKDVLRILGTPQNVCLKVSQGMDSFAVMPCGEKDALSFHVPDDFLFNRRRMMKIRSRSFVTGLLAMNDRESGHTYKISGTYLEKNNAVVFHMSDIRRYRE